MNWLRRLVDLVFPRRCAGCGRVGPAALCRACVPGGPPVLGAAGAWAVAPYAGAVRSALLRYKERGRRDLAPVLGVLLARAVRAALAGRVPPGAVLVPVPTARAAAAARGGDHLLAPARGAGRELGRPVVRALRVVRAGRDSAGLGAAERARERHGSMTARAPRAGEAGCVAVVVDDIVTTGATLREAVRALRAAGWVVAGCATIAATPRIRKTHPVTTGRSHVVGLA